MNVKDPSGKKQRIMDAAIKLISENGYYGATTALIAKEAGVSQGIIFHYYGSKEGLFFAIIEDGSKMFLEEIEKNIYGEKDILKKIEKIVFTYCDIIENHEELFVTLAKVEGSGLDMRKKIVNRFTKMDSVKLFREILEEGTKQEVIRKIDLDVAVSSFFGILNFNAFRWLRTEKSFPLRNSIKTAVDIFIRGIKK